MKLRAIVLSVLSLCLPALAQTTEPAAQAPDNMQLFLLVGQSNMAGRGTVGEEDKVTNPHIFMLSKDMKWVLAKDPVHFDKPGIAGVGLSSEFARTLVKKNPSITVGLIPCAFGGTSLDQWKKGDNLYSDAIARTREAMKKGTLKGILWHQGEADSSAEKSATYPQRFITMMTAMREDLNAADAPVIIGEIGYFNPQHATINAALAKIPAQFSHCALATAEDLKDRGDKLHFDTPSLKILGQRYEAAYEKLTK